MNSINKLSIKAALGCLLTAAACTPAERSHRDVPAEASDTVVDATTKAKVSTADIDMDGGEKAFIISSYSQSLYMVDLSTITTQSQNGAVRKLGASLTSDYQQMVKGMEELAKSEGLLLQRQLSDAQRKELDALKKLSSPTLDQQVLQRMNQLMATFTTLFKEGSHLKSEKIKAFADQGLPMVQKQQATVAKLISASTDSGTQSTRPGEVSTEN